MAPTKKTAEKMSQEFTGRVRSMSTKARKPPARERPRPGAILVELSPDDRAKLLAVQKACTEARGMPVPISWTVRLAIREMWDHLTPGQKAWRATVENSREPTTGS